MTSVMSTEVPSETELFIKGHLQSEVELMDAEVAQLKTGFPAWDSMDGVNEIMKEACVKRMEDDSKGGFYMYQCGTRVGDPVFRDHLAKFLTKLYGYRVKRENIIATNGATLSLYHLCTLFFRAGDVVFAEEPSFSCVINFMKHELSRKLVHVSMDDNGILTSELETKIQQLYPAEGFTPTNQRPYWSMLYLIPVFHNPTGCSLSEERCKVIVKLARKYHLLVVCDDLYNLVRWGRCENGKKDTSPTKLLKYFDRESDPDFFGNIVSNCSFSKIMAAGLRFGWMDAPPFIMDKLASSHLLDSGGDLNHFLSAVMGKALEIGRVEEHIKNTCSQYKDKLQVMHRIFQEKLKGIVKYNLPEGGFFVWVQLPDGMHCEELAELCEVKYRVTIGCGNRYTTNEGRFTNFIRICFTFCPKEQFVEGIKQLSEAILELQGRQKL